MHVRFFLLYILLYMYNLLKGGNRIEKKFWLNSG